MQITEKKADGAMILMLHGDFDLSSRRDFNAAVEKARSTGCKYLIIDLESVRFLDSAALGLLSLINQNFKLEQRKLSLMKPQEYVHEVLTLANIPKLIPVYATEKDALHAVGNV